MQEKYPQKPGLDFILKQAFYYWNRTLFFQLMFSIIYLGIFLTAYFFLSEKYQIIDQIFTMFYADKNDIVKLQSDISAMQSSESYLYFQLGILGTLVFLYPLNLGLYQIYRKIDLKEPISLSDLFVGYNGLNFFRYASYFMFWFLTMSIIFGTILLPIVWVMVTLFIAPLMFFQNKTIFEGIALNWKALKMYFIEIFVCVIVAFFFKYIGFTLFLVGGLFTLPFWNAMIYSLYKTIFDEKS